MATDAQRARRRAQRATAKAVREHRRQLPAHVTRRARAVGSSYANDVFEGRKPKPEPGTPQSRMLAQQASFAQYGKAPYPWYQAFKEFFYHKAGQGESGAGTDEDSHDE